MEKPKQWTIGFIVAMVLVGAIILSTRYYEVDLPVLHFLGFLNGPDPATLHLRGEFVESNLGLAQGEPLTVRMVAEQYNFVPQCIVVPAGVPVRFRITSADAVHMLSFAGTKYAIKAIPGVVSEDTLTFTTPGTYPMPCHEFCGPGHFTMRSQLEVVAKEQFAPLRPGERRACGPH